MRQEIDAPVAGGTVRAWRAGAPGGPAVLLLHGGPGMSDYLDDVSWPCGGAYDVGAELGDAYDVIGYQQRGLDPSTTSGPFDVGTHVDDAVAVLDAAGVERAHVVGHSWGGYLAMHLVAARPDRVLGVVAVDPLGAVGDGGASDAERTLAGRLSPAGASAMAELDPDDDLGRLRLVWPGYFVDPATAAPMPPIELSARCGAGTWVSIDHHIELRTLESLLPRVEVPCAFVLGADSSIPPAHGVATAALIPGAVCQVLPHCGHFPWVEHPGSVRRALDAVASRAVTGDAERAARWRSAGRDDRPGRPSPDPSHDDLSPPAT